MQKKEPTTEEIRTALKELLSVQKVEFNVATENRLEMFKIAEKISANADKLVDEFENNKKRAANSIKSLNTVLGKITKIYVDTDKQISSAAKELGIAPNDVPDFAKFIKSYFFLENSIKEDIEELKKWL